MLRADLLAARKAWLKESPEPQERAEREKSDSSMYRNQSGLVAGFHSLRGPFVTNLSRGGAHLPLAQALARHSDPALTANVYTRVTLAEQSRALAGLPDLGEPFRQTAVMTGTDDRPLDSPHAPPERLAVCLADGDSFQSAEVQSDALKGTLGATNNAGWVAEWSKAAVLKRIAAISIRPW